MSFLPEKGMPRIAPLRRLSSALHEESQEEASRSNSCLIPTVPALESPSEYVATPETPSQSPYDGNVSYPPEEVAEMEPVAESESELREQIRILRDRLNGLRGEQEVASSSSSFIIPHPGAEDGEEVQVLRQLVEDMRTEIHALRALDEPPPEYQPD
jgi:hypothetical protein